MEPNYDDIVKQIKNEKYNFWDSNSITKYLTFNQIELNQNQLIKLTKKLVEKDIFGLLYAITSLLKETASNTTEYASLLKMIYEKIKNDMVQGPFINAMIQIGKNDSKVGINLAQKLINSGNNSIFTSCLLGGSSKTDLESCLNIIDALLHTKEIPKQIVAIQTLRVINKVSIKYDTQKILLTLDDLIKINDPTINQECLEGFLDVYDVDRENIEPKIIRLVESSTECKYSIAVRIKKESPFTDEISLKFLEICSKDANLNVKQRVCYALVCFVKKYPEQVLEILAHYVIRDEYGSESIGYVLDELGKVNVTKSIQIMLSWISSDRNNNLSRHVPHMAAVLACNKKCEDCLESIFRLICTDEKHRDIGLDCLLEIVSKIYTHRLESKSTQIICKFLISFTKKQGIDTTPLIKIENNSALLSADMIHMLKYYSKDLDYDTIFQNLVKFPHIRGIFSKAWFEQKHKQNNRTHPILKMLEQKLPDHLRCLELTKSIENPTNGRDLFNNTIERTNLMSTSKFLSKLNLQLDAFDKQKLPLKDYTRNLKNEQQFDSTMSEIDFVYPFISKYKVKLEPKINSKKLDAENHYIRLDVEIEIESQILYVEIISPDTYKPLNKLIGARGIPNRIKEKIYDKFNHQLKELLSSDQPVIIAIDISRSEVDYDFVKDYLFGTMEFTLHIDNNTQKDSEISLQRNESESMHNRDNETDIITAIICYKSKLCDDLKYRTEGRIFENLHAKTTLNPSVKKAIEESLFSKS